MYRGGKRWGRPLAGSGGLRKVKRALVSLYSLDILIRSLSYLLNPADPRSSPCEDLGRERISGLAQSLKFKV